MKKIIALLIIICMISPMTVFAQGDEIPKIYIFGDEWAEKWGEELKGFINEQTTLFNLAKAGDVLSGLKKKPEYNSVGEGDIVILSYGVLEKDRPGDKNSEFKKNLEDAVKTLTKKGAKVIFASICSTMRYNTLTGRMEETKNFYTESIKNYAKTNQITYIDLASLTATKANELGIGRATELYKSNLSLTDSGNRMCAFKVFEVLESMESLKGCLKINLSRVYTVNPGEKSVVFDLFFEKEISENYVVYIKGGSAVKVNEAPVANGDEKVYCNIVNGQIKVDFNFCEKIQVTPLYKFNASGHSTTEAPYKAEVFPGVYDVTVKKTEPLKASVYLNGYLIASNLDMPGTQPVLEAAEHTFRNYHLLDGNVEVGVKGLTDKLDYISFAESAAIYEEKPRIFVGGDSTLCNYYPLERTGNEADGTVMTGWAMLLENYVDAEVVNLAASGDWASKWKASSFSIIEKEGKKGDIFIIQFGINDRYNTTLEDMKETLGEMVDLSAQKGMIPILVSPQISAGYGWGDESEIGKSDGGDYVEFFNAVRDLSIEKGCFYVDLTDLSSGWFSEIGRDAVYKKYHIWDYENDKPKDMMHLSYKGADAMCRFFVLGLKKISDANQKDKWGNSLDLLKIW